MKLFRSNARALEMIRLNLDISFDHKKQIILGKKNQESLRIAKSYVEKAINKLDQII